MVWEERLSGAGRRITAPRRAVMAVLQEADVPLSPQEICERGGAVHPTLGLTTVYRTVALLAQLGVVRRVHRSDGCHGYVATSPGHRHHVLCEMCGRAAEFPGSEDLTALIRQVERSTAFRVEAHLLQLFGMCPDCQRRRV
jgi:Fur family ferric uptake transcriptional regulator